jgi:drug/metabolite transporter (DMT)-like permease
MIWFVLAICSALLSASSAVIQKKILFRLTALEFSFLVSAIILAVSLFVPFSVDVASIPSSALMILIGKSILGGIVGAQSDQQCFAASGNNSGSYCTSFTDAAR